MTAISNSMRSFLNTLIALCVIPFFSACEKKETKKNSPDYKIIPGRIAINANSVIQLKDKNLLFCTISDDKLWLVKVRPEGQELWRKPVDSSTYSTEGLVAENANGDMFIGRNSFSTGNFLITKTDANGNLLWHKEIGDRKKVEYFSTITATDDGGMVICGLITAKADPRYWDINVMKINSNGDSLWQRPYYFARNILVHQVRVAANSDLLILGSQSDAINSNFYLRLSSEGGFRAFLPFPGGSSNCTSFVEMSDGTLASCGQIENTFEPQVAMVIHELSYPTQIKKATVFGLGFTTATEFGISISNMPDGNLMLTGTGYHHTSQTSSQQFLLIKTNTNGQNLWYRQFGKNLENEWATSAFFHNGKIVVSGALGSFGGSQPNDVSVLFQLDGEGNF
jgi:hypothetical protein